LMEVIDGKRGVFGTFAGWIQSLGPNASRPVAVGGEEDEIEVKSTSKTPKRTTPRFVGLIHSRSS
jgi:hypothetical protein